MILIGTFDLATCGGHFSSSGTSAGFALVFSSAFLPASSGLASFSSLASTGLTSSSGFGLGGPSGKADSTVPHLFQLDLEDRPQVFHRHAVFLLSHEVLVQTLVFCDVGERLEGGKEARWVGEGGGATQS